MKKIIILYLGVLCATSAKSDLFSSGDLSLAIPDGSSLGVSSSIAVSGMSGSISNISVDINIGAVDGDTAFNGDFYVYLRHDDTLAVLLNRPGKTAANPFGYGDNGMDVTFVIGGDDIHYYTRPGDGGMLTGVWGADGRETDPEDVEDTDPRTAMLDVFFENENPNGDWTLFLADKSSGATAQLNDWSLSIQTVPEPYTITMIALAGSLTIFIRRRFCSSTTSVQER